MWWTESVEVGRAGSASSSVPVASDVEAAQLPARRWPPVGAGATTASFAAAVSSSSSEEVITVIDGPWLVCLVSGCVRVGGVMLASWKGYYSYVGM